MSSPAGRTLRPGAIGRSTTTVAPSRLAGSCGTTASAPSGIGAPVEIRTAVPRRTVTSAAVPALASPMTRSRAGPPAVSTDRIAKRSIADAANGATWWGACASPASTRPSASSR
jgi:hypothetical protein